MYPNYFLRSLIICVFVFCVWNCDGYRTEVKIVEKGKNDKKKVENITETRRGRGFLPTGGLFALGKVLNFFPVGGERECIAKKGVSTARSGICLNPYDCRQRDGKAAGDCAHGLGVCCVFEVTCGGSVSNNLTYFVSPGFPDLWTGGDDCSITIEKAHAGIMQLRVDFVQFNIGQPNRTTGECDRDVMTLGGDGNQFKLCGQNHGQHIYYTLSTASEARDEDDLAGSQQTKLTVRATGALDSRVWLMRLAQMPLANSAPNDCLQYFTGDSGVISTFNYAVNGRHLAAQDYRACIRKNPGMCAVRYQPCDERSFRIGRGQGDDDYPTAPGFGPGGQGGPGTGFYGPDGSFVSDGELMLGGSLMPVGSPETQDQVADAENDPVMEEMVPAESEVVEDEIEGSGDEPEAAAAPAPPSLMSRIWSFIWPSWLWGQARAWRWSPYTQHYGTRDEWTRDEDTFVYQGYGNYGDGLRGYGRMQCQDRITIPCDSEYLISNTLTAPGVCDPHHCGTTFCPGLPFSDCHVQTSMSPFAVSVHFGEARPKPSVEDNIGACLAYTQMACDS